MPNFTTAIRDHTNVKCVIISQIRLRMVWPWPDQPDQFRRLWSYLVTPTCSKPRPWQSKDTADRWSSSLSGMFGAELNTTVILPASSIISLEITTVVGDVTSPSLARQNMQWKLTCRRSSLEWYTPKRSL